MEYYIEDSDPAVLITTPEFESVLSPLTNKRKLLIINQTDVVQQSTDSEISNIKPILTTNILGENFYKNSNALILYTSGTTGKPKGVVLSHSNINAQINSLNSAWQMSQNDVLLHVLPLNHVHGTINSLLLPLFNGSKIIMLPKFDSAQVWTYLLNINMKSSNAVNVFMAVPTIYDFLIKEYTQSFSENIRLCDYIKVHCSQKIRLMVSGSAPLPLNIYKKWNAITGHNLLERYGMTETGMALSNAYVQDKVRTRIPGAVGYPLPGVEARIVDNTTSEVLYQAKGEDNKGVWIKSDLPVYDKKDESKSVEISGNLHIRGPLIFKDYWRKPAETKKEFSEDNWFITGDTASVNENNVFKILGRTSIDIIKSGGHKLSALEIENIIREYPLIEDVAILGVNDITWGQRVAALIIIKDDVEFDEENFNKWTKEQMPVYMAPTVLKIVKEIPRNAMGKINKKQLQNEFFGDNNS